MWGKGIATSFCSELVAGAHARSSMLRVQATVLKSNAKSAAVPERCGFAREGLFDSYLLIFGRPANFHMHSHVVPLRTAT